MNTDNCVENIRKRGTLHLLNDLGVYKSALKRSFYQHYGDRVNEHEEHCIKARDLLERRGQFYTLDECIVICAYISNGHTDCVLDHPDEYSSVEVYSAERTVEKSDAVYVMLNRIKECVPVPAGEAKAEKAKEGKQNGN